MRRTTGLPLLGDLAVTAVIAAGIHFAPDVVRYHKIRHMQVPGIATSCTGTMHELSIAMSLIDVAAEEAQRRGAHVRAVHVKIGVLSGVVKEALCSAYELAREGTELAESRLVVEEVPIVVYCEHCRADRAADTIEFMRCSRCGTLADRIVSGRELEMTALEIEQR